MSPETTGPFSQQLSFPRVSGDEPDGGFKWLASFPFSPRERG